MLHGWDSFKNICLVVSIYYKYKTTNMYNIYTHKFIPVNYWLFWWLNGCLFLAFFLSILVETQVSGPNVLSRGPWSLPQVPWHRLAKLHLSEDKNLECWNIAVGTICIGARANPQESHDVHNSYLRSTVHIYSMFGNMGYRISFWQVAQRSPPQCPPFVSSLLVSTCGFCFPRGSGTGSLRYNDFRYV